VAAEYYSATSHAGGACATHYRLAMIGSQHGLTRYDMCSLQIHLNWLLLCLGGGRRRRAWPVADKCKAAGGGIH